MTPLPPTPSRRTVLCGLASAALVPTALAACSSEDGAAPGGGDSGGGDSGGGDSGGGAATGNALTPLADVPVGGGVVVEGPDGPVVVVQPSAGRVAAFSAVCTHEGTTVDAPEGGIITCPNHGSEFQPATGEVARGPASAPLPPVAVRVAGDQVVLA